MKQFLLAVSLIALPVVAFTSFEVKFGANPATAANAAGLGDMSAFKVIVADVQSIADKGDLVAAEKRIRDYEQAWDQATNTLRATDKAAWGNVDDASDTALKDLRDKSPDAAKVKASLTALMNVLNNPSAAN